MAPLGVWTMGVVVLTAIVLAKPPWFWQFLDPWTCTTVAAADLPWVEALNLRPVIVLVCGSLVLIFAWLAGNARPVVGQASQPDVKLETPTHEAPLLTRWLSLVTLAVRKAKKGVGSRC
jgi:hypothetical protein